MSRGWLAVVLALAACSSGTKRVGGKPSWRGHAPAAKPVGPVTFAPTSEPAARYNEPQQAPAPSPLGDAVVAAVKAAATKANLPVPAADARLFRACAELAEIIPEDGVIAHSAVEFVLQRHGIVEPLVYRVAMWRDPDDLEDIVAQIEPQLAQILADGAHARVGIGAAKRKPDGTGAIVFALQASDIATNRSRARSRRVATSTSMRSWRARIESRSCW